MFKFAIVTAIFAFLYAYRHLTPKFIDDHHDTTYYHAIDLSSSGTKLRNSLYKLIRRHRVLTYKEVWEAMEDIDRGNCSRGQVFDIYSGRCWFAVTDRCGAGGTKSEGHCFNREHAWPKSWCDL